MWITSSWPGLRGCAPDSGPVPRGCLNHKAYGRLASPSIAFERNPLESLVIINAPNKSLAYGSEMRSLRSSQLFRRAHGYAALEHMRRLVDLLIAGFLLAMTGPLMLFVALAIKFEGPGPIFERQVCIGRGGRRFQMLKFRTIIPDPEHTLPIWARNPTQIGKLLRYSRIESLPQLINVMRGEMSIIDTDGASPSFLE